MGNTDSKPRLSPSKPHPLPEPIAHEYFNEAELREQLNAAVRRENPPCSCDLCHPEKYTPKFCHGHAHKELVFREPEVNRYGNTVFKTPEMSYRSYDALHLARRCIEYIDRDEKHMTERQLEALKTLRGRLQFSCIWTRSRPIPIPEVEVEELLLLMARVFFPGDMTLKFVWEPGLKAGGGLCAHCRMSKNMATITMDPAPYTRRLKGEEATWEGRVGVRISLLLHEALHAFLYLYSCEEILFMMDCEGTQANIGQQGHGRAFQLVAAAIDRVAPGLLGFPIGMGGLLSYVYNDMVADSQARLPSLCDLDQWNVLDSATEKESENR